uniref:CZB domain-containing protein n=1 Tax=Haemonchus contortus TaxID=6289 RepID=A0A7I4YVJ0_HAECO
MMSNNDGLNQIAQQNERTLVPVHEGCCQCGGQHWYEYQMKRLTEAVGIAQAQAQAEAAYSRQLHCEGEILEIALEEAVDRMCKLRQRFERNNIKQKEML